MKKRTLLFTAMLAFGLLLLGHTPQASAYSSFYSTYCTGCHGTSSASTCAGCHAHGTHGDSSKSGLNLTAVTDKTSYQPGETVSVTINGGYRSGWVRAILYNGDPAAGGVEVARSTGPSGEGGGQSFPIALTGKAPATAGTYKFSASWYGNKYDLTDAGAGTTVFGPKWTPDPSNPNHGQEIVATNSFTVVSSTPLPAAAITVTDSVSPTTDHLVAFGNISVGASAVQTVTIKNTGNANLILGVVGSVNPLGAPFAIKTDTCSSQTLAAAASCSVTLVFAPVSAASFTDSFSISSNDAANSTVTMNVSGAGTSVLTPAITVTDSVSPTTDLLVAFGNVTVSALASQTVTIKNSGSANLTIGAIGSSNGLAAPFAITSDSCSNQTVIPAAACTLTVAFTPASAAVFTDSFSVPSNDPSKSTVTMNVSGTGAAAPMPNISVTDAVLPSNDLMLPFGTITAGSTAAQTVTIKNSGNADLMMGSIGSIDALAAPFMVQTDTCSGKTLVPSASCTMALEFSPTTLGAFTDSVSIPSNDPDQASLTLSVSGIGSTTASGDISVTDSVAPIDDLQVPFGNVREGRSVDNAVSVSNTAAGDLVLGNLASISQLAAPFVVVSDTCSGKTLSSGETCGITIRFTPVAGCADSSGTPIGTGKKLSCKYSDSFDVPSDDPDEPAVTVQVSGAGVSSKGNNSPGKPGTIYPAALQQGLDTTIQMTWTASSDPDGDPVTYDLLVSPTQDFSGTTTTTWTAAGKKNAMFAGTGMSFIFFGVVFAGIVRSRKGLLLFAALAIAAGTTLVSCGPAANKTASVDAVTRQVSGLSANTTYYWKVVAKDDSGGVAESDSSSFTTK
jgi:hypothetical protein